MVLCIGMVCFLLFTPSQLVKGAQESFQDARFVRDTERYTGSILLYHIVRRRPYAGSLTQWLKRRAEAYEKKHKGTYLEIEGMDEKTFLERMEGGRRPDAYSFFSGSMYADRLQTVPDLCVPMREGLFQTERCIPYCYSGYCRLIRRQDRAEGKLYCGDDILAARLNVGENNTEEEKADILYLDLRRAGDLIRYREGFSLSVPEPIDCFTDAVCWIGVDRETDPEKTAAILDFAAFLLTPESQQTLDALGLFSVRSDVRQTPPDPMLKTIFQVYGTVNTVDPFLWQIYYDALSEDAQMARHGDRDAYRRFANRLRECLR